MFRKDIFKDLAFSALLTGLFVLASVGLAHAASGADAIQATTAVGGGAGSTMGDVFNSSCTNTVPFANLVGYVAYAAGALFALMGVNQFRLHIDSPANHPMNRGIMLWVGAACLMALPSIMKTVAMSLGYATDPTMAGCLTAGAAGASSAGGTGLDGMVANFVNNIKAPLTSLTQVIANVVGAFMMVNGLMKASKYGFDPKTNSIHSVLANVVFGAILFTIGGSFSMVSASVLGGTVSDDTSVLKWTLNGQAMGAQFQTAVNAALSFVQIIGFIAFVRGWMIMKKVVEGGGNVSMAQGMTHIIGGVLAVNIAPFLKIMDTTFGTNLLT